MAAGFDPDDGPVGASRDFDTTVQPQECGFVRTDEGIDERPPAAVSLCWREVEGIEPNGRTMVDGADQRP
jgi:hypothetical protein